MTPRRPSLANVVDGVVAGAAAAALSPAPSTLHALLSTGKPLEAALAAGTLLRPQETRSSRLLVAALPVHATVSLGWALVLSPVLPRRFAAVSGAAAGLAIAAFDLGVVGRHFPRIRELPRAPQVADHLAYGAVVGAVLSRRRARRAAAAASRRARCAPHGRRDGVGSHR